MPFHSLSFKTVFLLASVAILFTTLSCGKKYANDDFRAYFGGEVSNPTKRYVLFCKDNEVIDTIPLKADNTFFKSFKSLKPGLYTFRHDPEYQYVYFDKNDSLMVNINSRDFDESIVFCGRGDRKNNFLMELYLKNEKSKDALYPMFDQDIQKYSEHIDSVYAAHLKFYDKTKEKLEWSNGFDFYAKTMLEFNHYIKKEIYPQVHQARTGKSVQIPDGYFDFRGDIDFNNSALAGYSPFIKYLSHMMNNLADVSGNRELNTADLSLQSNIHKLHIVDTLIKSEKIKNSLLNSIAFNYLLDDQNIVNNKKFLDTYMKYSTDKSSRNEIFEIGNSIAALKQGKQLPDVGLVDLDGIQVSSSELVEGKKSIIFFWSENMHSHFVAASEKALQIQKSHPEFNLIAVNLDSDSKKWKKTLSRFHVPNVTQVQCRDFDEVTKKWAVIKIHRTIIVNADGTIADAFTNLFESDFDQRLGQKKLIASE